MYESKGSRIQDDQHKQDRHTEIDKLVQKQYVHAEIIAQRSKSAETRLSSAELHMTRMKEL